MIKKKANQAENQFDWASKNRNIADEEIRRLKEKHGFE